MKKMLKKISLLLALLMLISSVSLLASCSKDDEAADTSDTVATEGTPVEEEEVDYREFLPTADFDGADVRFFVMESRLNYFDLTDEESGAVNVVEQAIVARNDFVENTYNVYLDFVTTNKGWNDFHTVLRTNMMAEQSEFDVVSADYYYSTETGGYYHNMLDYETIHFDNPYWVNGWNENVTINNKIFTAVSYYSLDPVAKSEAIFINNYVADDYKVDVDAIKDKVRNGEWTIEEMELAMKAATRDEGDGEWTFEDNYGLAYNLWSGRAFLFSAGLSISTFRNGEVEWKFGDERTVDIYLKMYKFFNETAYCYYGGGANESDSTVGDQKLFLEGRALFAGNTFAFSEKVVQNLDSFSIIPMPKLDENQENYITNIVGSCVFGIPITAKNPEMSAAVLEAMSILSYLDVVPVYYEDMLKSRYQTDSDVAEMLDLIRNNISIDFAFVNDSNLGGIALKPFDLIVDYNKNIKSELNKIANTLDEKLVTFYAAYADAPAEGEGE